MNNRLLASLLAAVMLTALVASLPVSAYWKSDGFRYTFDHGEVTILGYVGESPDVVIPASFDGCPVTEIGSKAFEEEPIKSVVIPEGVKKIGAYAFLWCDSLERVTIPASLKEVSLSAFENCKALKRVDISDLAAWCAVFWGGTQTNPLSYARELYLNGKLVTDPVIPDGVTRIADCAFEGGASIKTVTFPKSLTAIGLYAFMGCENLKTIRYSGSEEDWNKIAFDEDDDSLRRTNVVFNFEPPAKGDVTGDGKINAKDVTAILRMLTGWQDDGVFPEAADHNGDGKINARDVTALMKAIVSAV